MARFSLCADGATVLEYALVLPILLLLIMGTVECALIMYSSSMLENAVTIAAREGSTYYTAPSETQLQTIEGILSARVGGLLNPAQLQINITPYSGGWGVLQPPVVCSNGPPSTCTQNFGAPGNIVVYSVSYPWHVITPFLRPFFGVNGDGILELTASSVVQNEPTNTYP